MRIILKSLLLSLAVCVSMLLTVPAVQAQTNCNPTDTKSALKCGTNETAGVPAGQDPGNSLSDTITTGINVASAVVAVVAVIMIIVGGARFVASAGNEQGVKAAKSTLAYAIIGLVIVALAQIIVHFVLNNLTSATGSDSSPPASSQAAPRRS